MRQSSFSAQELICMAGLCEKKTIYGIPDGFAAVYEEDMPAAFQQVNDSLIKSRIAEMNFDGKVILHDEYRELIHVCCDCEKCLTVNIQRADRTAADYIFWQTERSLHMAEAVGNQYVFSRTDAAMIRMLTAEYSFSGNGAAESLELVIPQTELLKAKRQARGGNHDGAVRILRQNGADERLSHIIAEGLDEKAVYIGILYMDNRESSCRQTEIAYLNSQGAVFQLGQTVMNFRTCAVFREVDGADARQALSDLIDQFLDCGRESEGI